MTYRWRLAIAFSLVLFATGGAWGASHVDKTVPAEPQGRVAIENVAGAIHVTGWDRDEVHLEADVEGNPDDLEITSGPGRVTISFEAGHDGERHHEADMVIHVPRSSELRISSLSADTSVLEVSGELRVETVSGDVDVQAECPEIKIEAASGDVRVSAPAEKLEVASVSGDVHIQGVSGALTASVVSGDLDLQGRLDSAKIETTSGDLRFEGGLLEGAQLQVNSLSGDIDLGLPPDVSAEFRVTTFSGEIDNELGPPAKATQEHGPGRELKFSTAGGSARVEIRSFSGTIRLRKR